MAARYASLAGNRQVEFLPLSWPQVDFKEMVIRVKRAKQRGKKREMIIERIAISPDLHDLLLELKALNKERDADCLYVFPTRDNNPYTARVQDPLAAQRAGRDRGKGSARKTGSPSMTCALTTPRCTNRCMASCPTCTKTKAHQPASTTATRWSTANRFEPSIPISGIFAGTMLKKKAAPESKTGT